MTAALHQLRDGIRAHIAEDPTIVTPMRCPIVGDGFGGQAPSGTPEAQQAARIRIQHERGAVQSNAVGPAGLDTSLSLYALTDHRTPLAQGDTFTAFGSSWTVGPVNVFRRHGGIYKTEAPLVRGTAVPVTIPQDLAAAAASDTEIALSWSDVGSVNSYSIERKTETGAYAVIATPAAGTFAYTDSGLDPSTTYSYRMRAYDGSAWSAYTAEVSATTEAPEVP